jgi:zinc protease
MTATARPDSIALEATALSESTGSLLVLMSDILRSVAFPEHEVDLYRQGRNQSLRQEASQPATIAAKLVRGALFGSVYYGAPDPVTVDHLDRELLVQYRDSVFVPNNASLILIGKLPPRAELMKALTYVFGGWVEKKFPPSAAPKFPDAKRRLMLVDRPGATQAEIRVSRIGTALGSPEALPLLMASAIVGSSPDSRLMRELHDTLKPGDDVHTEVSMLADSGMFTASARVRNDIAGDVLAKMLANLERISNEPVDANELANAKSLAAGSFLLSMETQQTLADDLAMMKVTNLPKDYLEGYTTRAGAVDAARIQAAAKKWMAPADAVIVVVGDASNIRAQLEKVGPFETVNAYTGKPETGKPDAAKQPQPKP